VAWNSPGREIDQGEADDRGRKSLGYGGKKLFFAGVEDGDVGGGAGSYDGLTSRRTSFLPGPGLFHLLADGDFLKPARMRRASSCRGVIRDAAHGYGLTFSRLREVRVIWSFARGDDGIFVEEFVEVTETEEEEGVGVAVFTALYCCMRRCGGFGHGVGD